MSHYEAAILAAGMTCVYNADDWGHAAESAANDAEIAPSADNSAQH